MTPYGALKNSRHMTQILPASVPTELASQRAWLVWKFVPNGDKKPRKVPFYVSGEPRGGTKEAPRQHGSPEDLAGMATFEEAVRVARDGGWQGVGFALHVDQNLVALDFDDCVQDGVIDPRVVELVTGTYTEFSPSGKGVRAFMRGSLASKKDVPPNLKGPFAIEYFGHNGFVTVTGNVTDECALFGFDDTVCELTPAVLKDYASRFGAVFAAPSAQTFDDDGFGLMALSPTLDLSNAEIVSHMEVLPADLDYDTWVKVGMAVHQETRGEGFELWHNWSKASPKYTTEQYCMERWRSFGRFSGASITMAWLIKQANEQRARAGYKARDEWKAKLQACTDDFILREKLCPELARDERVGEMEREELAQLLTKVFTGIGTKLPIAMCRKLLAPRRAEKRQPTSDLPEWAQGWVYVTDDDNFFRLDSDEWLSMQAFNARFNRLQPVNEDGAVKKNAAWVALEDLGIETVTRGIYLPWAGPTFDLNGVHCANRYRPSSVPKAVETLSDAGRAAVGLVLKHLDMICGGRREVVDTLLAWMAHNVQKPGVKIRWTPLVKGVEGDGKTLLGQGVMSAVLGQPNVKTISPKVLGTDFSDWAHGACVGVLEEIKLTGHNRHDILNALKPFITNDQVAVHPKGGAEFNVVNTMNYMAFTNHADALPLGETDRRWYIVFTPFASKEALYAALGGLDAAGGYFDRLHTAIESQRAELRRWLLDYPIPASFKPNGSAPDTAEKALMVGMSTSPEEEAVREVLIEGAEGVTRDLLSSNCLADALALRDTDVSLQTTAVNRVLTRMGFAKVPAKLKWKGRSHRIWTKDIVNTEPDVLREVLEKTVLSASGEGESSESVVDLFNSEPHLELSCF
jgi:hypothetical protein